LHQRTNLSRLVALQLGYTPELSWTILHLSDIDQTAETIARFQPDCIFCTVTLRTSRKVPICPKLSGRFVR
jgi:hypothetical protein